jgi:hypothetical protein
LASLVKGLRKQRGTNRCKDIAHALSYTISLHYITLEIKSTVARQTIVGCSIPNNNKIRSIDKADFDKIDILLLGPLCA